MKRIKHSIMLLAGALALAAPALAHHGWGSYDAANPVTATGPIVTSKYENPHAEITLKAADKTWTVILAPTSRMASRGATKEMVAVGRTITVYGYPSKTDKNEMRAERITADGKTIELR